MVVNQSELRVMVDANILVSGSVWPRWPYEVLQHALRGDFQLVLNQYVMDGRFAFTSKSDHKRHIFTHRHGLEQQETRTSQRPKLA